MLFADRFEVWNPGELPPGLTPDQLREPHASLPRNPLLADPLFLAHYAERAGTGTLDMIARCRDAGLPEPTFEQRGGQFVITVWRDWLTDKLLAELSLNERQTKALQLARAQGRVTSADLQEAAGCSRATALRDLDELVTKRILRRTGEKRGTHYLLATKPPRK
jgi:ATP-dependent DNA helicase RecG